MKSLIHSKDLPLVRHDTQMTFLVFSCFKYFHLIFWLNSCNWLPKNNGSLSQQLTISPSGLRVYYLFRNRNHPLKVKKSESMHGTQQICSCSDEVTRHKCCSKFPGRSTLAFMFGVAHIFSCNILNPKTIFRKKKNSSSFFFPIYCVIFISLYVRSAEGHILRQEPVCLFVRSTSIFFCIRSTHLG